MSSIPCKYFARNECRFGDSCRYYHGRGGVGMGNAGGFGNRPQIFSNNNAQQETLNLTPKSQQHFEVIVETVKKDMIEWEQGKIWPISSYGPVGGKPSFPGFDDLSFEELRHRFIINNKMPPDLSQEMQKILQTRVTYQQPNAYIREIMERVIVKGEKMPDNALQNPVGWSGGSSVTVNAGIFGGSSSFGGASNSGSGFQSIHQNQNPPNVFGTVGQSSTNSIFGNQNTGTMDSMEGTQTQGNSVFSAPPNVGLFQTQANPQNQTFGSQGMVQSFGGNLNLQQQQAQSVFQTQPAQPQSLFAQPQQPSSGNLFLGQNQSNTFQTQPTLLQGLLSQPATFPAVQSQPQPSSNSSGPTTSSIFGGGTLQQSGTGTSSGIGIQSIFGVTPNQTAPSIFGQPASGPSIFGQPSSGPSNFGQPSTGPSNFGQSSSGPSNFGQSSSGPSNFGQPSSGPSIFGQPSSAPSVFGQPSSVPSVFGQPPSGSSIFGQVPTAGSSVLGQPSTEVAPLLRTETASSGSTNDDLIYSKESDLTLEELNAFKADYFTIENIPTKPPPKAYC